MSCSDTVRKGFDSRCLRNHNPSKDANQVSNLLGLEDQWRVINTCEATNAFLYIKVKSILKQRLLSPNSSTEHLESGAHCRYGQLLSQCAC